MLGSFLSLCYPPNSLVFVSPSPPSIFSHSHLHKLSLLSSLIAFSCLLEAPSSSTLSLPPVNVASFSLAVISHLSLFHSHLHPRFLSISPFLNLALTLSSSRSFSLAQSVHFLIFRSPNLSFYLPPSIVPSLNISVFPTRSLFLSACVNGADESKGNRQQLIARVGSRTPAATLGFPSSQPPAPTSPLPPTTFPP